MSKMRTRRESETGRDRFVRLANNRVSTAMHTLRLIGNLSNHAHYEYTDDDVKKIFKTLEEELRAAKQRFENAPEARSVKFELK